MAQGFKTGGRQVGTPNKNRTALRERLASNYPDYDPLALDLQSRTAEHRLGWYNLETEVGHDGGLTSSFAASKDWGGGLPHARDQAKSLARGLKFQD